MSKAFLGIDTSNYTTSVSLVRGGEVVVNSRKLLKVPEAARGLRQSDALFAHVRDLPDMISQLGKISDLTAIGVSSRPRDVEGSYMPCFLAGLSVARSVAGVCDLPCYLFSHQAGHIMAALYSCGRTDLTDGKFIAFHVSGGTTELLLVDNMKVTKLGGTLDISAGQLIDRVGVLLGLSFPCGKSLEEISAPLDSVSCISHVRDLTCNLSGAENVISKMVSEKTDPSAVAAFTLKTVLRTIDRLTENALEKYGKLPVIYAGGVMSNSLIRQKLAGKYGAYFAKPEFSCDNAAGIALLAAREYEKNKNDTEQ